MTKQSVKAPGPLVVNKGPHASKNFKVPLLPHKITSEVVSSTSSLAELLTTGLWPYVIQIFTVPVGCISFKFYQWVCLVNTTDSFSLTWKHMGAKISKHVFYKIASEVLALLDCIS